MGYRKVNKENKKHITKNEFINRVRFRLKKPFDQYNKGKIFNPFGGVVFGIKSDISTINFKDKDYFDVVINFTKEEIKKL